MFLSICHSLLCKNLKITSWRSDLLKSLSFTYISTIRGKCLVTGLTYTRVEIFQELLLPLLLTYHLVRLCLRVVAFLPQPFSQKSCHKLIENAKLLIRQTFFSHYFLCQQSRLNPPIFPQLHYSVLYKPFVQVESLNRFSAKHLCLWVFNKINDAVFMNGGLK